MNKFVNEPPYMDNTNQQKHGKIIKIDTHTAKVLNYIKYIYIYIYSNIRIGQGLFRSSGSELMSDG